MTKVVAMEYQCDADKAAANLQKHRISFADAVAVFSDEFALTVADDFADKTRFVGALQFRQRCGFDTRSSVTCNLSPVTLSKERFIILGTDAFGQLLVVVYIWRGEHSIRIISARKATRREQAVRRIRHDER